MKRIIVLALLFLLFYFLPEMMGGISIEKGSFEFAIILSLNAMIIYDWFGMITSGRIDWGKKK